MLMLGRKPVSPLCMPYAGFEKATNCVLDIPQNLKLEYNNGVVTLKTGSVIVLTGDTYSTITTTQDVTWSSSAQANTKQYLFITKYGFAGGLYGRSNLNKADSGPNLPADGSTYLTFFNTTDKIIYQWNPDNSEWESTTLCYPLGIIEIGENGNITGFAKDSNGNDMIFNGAGFIGHHAFIYPGIKALIPNGFNSDGSYKTIEATTNSLSIHEMVLGTGAYGDGSRYFAISTSGNITGWGGYTIREKDEDFTNDNWLRQYIKESNKTYTWTGSEKQQMYETPFINYKCDTNGLVTKFDVSQPLTRYRWVVKLIP